MRSRVPLLTCALLLLLIPSASAQERVKDKKYWLAVSVAAAVGAADFAVTQHCLKKYPPLPEHRIGDVFYGPTAGCVETNPLLGNYPSAHRQAATGAAFHAGAAWAAYELKKRHKWYWWAPQAGLIAVHAYGLVSFTRGRYGYPKLPGKP